MKTKKTVLISGGSRGIGKACARLFARNDYKVIICSKNQNNLEKARSELNNIFTDISVYRCDVSDSARVRLTVNNIYKEFSGIDVLINSAGISKLNRLEENDEENYQKWHEHLNVNLSGAYYFSREIFLKMKEQNKPGRIINISSVYGLIGGEGYSAYCATKHGLIGMTKSMALEMAPYNITVNAICPGWVEDTDMFEKDMQDLSDTYNIDKDLLIEEEKNAVPLKSFLKSEEIADLALYLASEAAKNISGQAINISGGLAV